MRIGLIGVNHRTAAVDFREKLALAAGEIEAAISVLRRRYPEVECVLLSTCNRTELYTVRPSHEPPTDDDLRHFLADCGGVSNAQLTAASIHHDQDGALHHLFRVSSGLESMVLGEPQILGQVKRAYELAVRCGTVGPVLHLAFQRAIATTKRLRHTTTIGIGRVSVGSVAVDLARQVFADFSDKTIVGLGAGEIAKTTLRHLLGLSPKRLWVSSRRLDRATALAEHLHLTGPGRGARHWEELGELLVEADIVVTSTGAREAIITVERFKPLLRRRRSRPLVLIDIAVPRDVQPQVGGLSNVYLYNIDDLQSVVASNYDQRCEQVERCEDEVASAVTAAMVRIRKQDLGQLVRRLRRRLHDIGADEQRRTAGKLAALPDAPGRQAIQNLFAQHTHRLINKILHLPLSQLDRRDADAPLSFYAAALRRLFRLDDPAQSSAEPSQEPAPVEEPAPAKSPSQKGTGVSTRT